LRNDRGSIKGSATFVYVPLQSYTEKELNWAARNEGDSLYNESRFLTRRRAVKIRSLHRMRQTGEAIPPTAVSDPWTLPLQIQVFRIGDHTAIVGLPGELFSEIGIRIKEQSPFPVTLVVSLTNSHIAYVPTRRAFAEGGYEAINSRLSPDGGEILAETAIRLLSEQSDTDKIPNGYIR
jgi:neutral ceramidase